MKKLSIILACLVSLTLPHPSFAGDNSFWGTGVGAALGGLLGSQFGKGDGQLAATGLGVFMGGAIGNSIGTSMDRANSAYASRGVQTYTPYYGGFSSYEPNYVAPPAPPPPRVVYVQPQIVEYRRAPSAVYVEEGYLGPQPPPPPNRHCREFTQKIKIDGQVHESYGTACLRPDGSWQIER